MNPQDNKWMIVNELNLEEELQKNKCLRTNQPFNGVLSSITIACIDTPKPKVLWWYRNKKNAKRIS